MPAFPFDVLIVSPFSLMVSNGTGVQTQVRELVYTLAVLYPKHLHFTVASPQNLQFPTNPDTLHPLFRLPNITVLNVIPQMLDMTPGFAGLTLVQSSQLVASVMSHYYRIKSLPTLIHSFDWNFAFAVHTLSQYFHVPWYFSCTISMKKSIQALQQLRPNYDPDGLAKFTAILEDYAFEHATYIQHPTATQLSACPPFTYKKSSVVPNGIHLSEFQLNLTDKKQQQQWRWGQDIAPKKVLYLGRLVMQKNLQNLLKSRIPNGMQLVIAGPTDTADSVTMKAIQEATSITIQDEKNPITFIGPVYGTDKVELLHAVDFLILPSLAETFGLVMLEAMATGTVVISSFADGMKDVVDPTFAVNCGTTVDSISLALQKCSDMSTTEYATRVKIGSEKVKTYSWEQCAQQTFGLYQHVGQYFLST